MAPEPTGLAPTMESPRTPSAPPERAERDRLCDLFLELGPDAPTLCEGWTAAHLASHLVVRERNPVASVGIVVGPLHRWHDDAIERTRTRVAWPDLVAKVRSGPPFGPMRWFDHLVNTQEYFVHHEDLRRGAGDHSPRPADEIADVEAALWDGLRRGGRLATRSVRGIGVDLREPDGEVIHARGGDDVVTIAGRPGEIVLYLLGRRGACTVELLGDADAVTTLEQSPLGI